MGDNDEPAPLAHRRAETLQALQVACDPRRRAELERTLAHIDLMDSGGAGANDVIAVEIPSDARRRR